MRAADLTLNAAVEIWNEGGRILIEPLQRKTYVLEDLLNGITIENLHETIEFGPAGFEYAD